MSEDGVREVTGVKGVRADDLDKSVSLILDEQFVRPFITLRRPDYTMLLTPTQARRVARQLYRLARRIEQREQGN